MTGGGTELRGLRSFVLPSIIAVAAIVVIMTVGSALLSLVSRPVQNEADINNSEEMQIVLDRNFEGVENVEVYAHSATITVEDDRVDAVAICEYAIDAANGYTFDFPHWQGNGGILSDEVTLREATVSTGGWFAEETECQFSRS